MTTPHPSLAPRMRSVAPSATAAVSDAARQLSAEGRTVINLGEGELDFPTPDPICAAAHAAIDAGQTRYTAVQGTGTLLAAIRSKFQTDYGITFGDDELVAGTGAKQIIFSALQATVGAGDEVIVPAPYWVSYPDMVRLADGTPIIVSCPESSGFKLQPDQLEQALTPQTKWVILNSPNNPTGAVYSAAELAALAAVFARHPHVFVLADDIYEHFVYEGGFAAIASVAPELRDRILTVNGVSKGYAMTGWRLGYAAGPAWLIKAITTLHSQSTSNPSSISQAAAAAALTEESAFHVTWQATLSDRRDMVMRALAETDGRLTASVPKGAFYVFANCEGAIGTATPNGNVIGTDVDLATYLLQEAGVATVPGTAFGASPFLRIAYAVDTPTLQTACDAMVAALARLRRD